MRKNITPAQALPDTAVRKPVAAIPAGYRDYVAIARPDHWFKNVFMVPGMFFAFVVYRNTLDIALLIDIMIGVAATCAIASANYVINEFLDAEFDRHHPEKSKRTAVQRVLDPRTVYAEYALLGLTGLFLAHFISMQFMVMEAFLLFMGIMYNVRPFRTKERVYLDVLSESINNPIRFALGWFIFVPAAMLPAISDPAWLIMPPTSILVAYWMGGAFLMATKRFAEYRFIGDPQRAGLYRRSFKYYTEENLLISMFFYALTSTFFLGIFLIKNRIELLISFPFFALLFAWYLKIGLRRNSPVQGPEGLYKEKKFMGFLLFFSALLVFLMFVDIEKLNWLLRRSF